MRLTTALLCDHATVREGLLHVLGGGVNTLTRYEIPAPFDVDLAVVIEMSLEELQREHSLTIRGFKVDGEVENEVLVLNAELGSAPEATASPENLMEHKTPFFNVPMILPTKNLVVGAEGLHRFDLELDGTFDTSLWFRVTIDPDAFQELEVSGPRTTTG